MTKKLYKIEEGKQLDGVCGGLAEYFNIDVTLVRLIWALVTLCTAGVGIIGYLICSVIMPKKSEVIG
jgi:phage shock protein C